ncbi:MAG: CSLREA domain-containing protein, partial [Cyanobacteria bacterium J06648_11]
MMYQRFTAPTNWIAFPTAIAVTLVSSGGLTARAQTAADISTFPALKIVVNTAADGPVEADERLTLREAISIANGALALDDLSAAERAQVSDAKDAAIVSLYENEVVSRIEFDLPPDDTTVRLVDALPPLAAPGLVLTGRTQPGYDADTSPTAEIFVPRPVVAMTPERDRSILRGLTIVADGVTVRGLSLYGFTVPHGVTAATPPADIFISHRFPPPQLAPELMPARRGAYRESDVPPKDVAIEENWLGIQPDEST